MTLTTPRVDPVRRPKAFICRKVLPLARVILPAEVSRQLAHPSCLAHPRRVRDLNVNGWLKFGKRLLCHLGQGSSGEGLSRVPETIYLAPSKRFIIQHAKLVCACERISRIFIYRECVIEVCEAERNWRGKSS